MTTFKSIFATRLAGYVELRQGLGFKFETQSGILRAFDQYVYGQAYEGLLTQQLAMDFAVNSPFASAGQCGRRYQVVRHFSQYLATFEPITPVLDPRALRMSRHQPPAYIYTEEELTRLLHEAWHISKKHPLRGVTLHAMIGLSSSTGLRIGEVMRLDKGDVDHDAGELLVRQSKFNKDRLVPVHPTTFEVLRNYARQRDLAFPQKDCPSFFLNFWGRRFTRQAVEESFREITRRAGLRSSKGKGPRFQDLRHAFAVRRLVAWYRAGLDINAMLPVLATYMGHAHYSATAYYITATPELMSLAAARHHEKLGLHRTEVQS